jgi:hypothetical protein
MLAVTIVTKGQEIKIAGGRGVEGVQKIRQNCRSLISRLT